MADLRVRLVSARNILTGRADASPTGYRWPVVVGLDSVVCARCHGRMHRDARQRNWVHSCSDGGLWAHGARMDYGVSQRVVWAVTKAAKAAGESWKSTKSTRYGGGR